MDESLQQVLALTIVIVIVGFEIRRRRRKKLSGKVGCDSCGPDKIASGDEAPIKFYKRR
jgi:hypothetical protein